MSPEQNLAEQIALARSILRPERVGFDPNDDEQMLVEAECLARLVLDLAGWHRAEGRLAEPSGIVHQVHPMLSQRQIQSVEDANQNIAKNTESLTRGNLEEFDSILPKALDTVRPILPMPELDIGGLTFASVMSLFVEMLETPSQGAHEQFIAAAVLTARVKQGGGPQQRVETKPLTAPDQSSRAACDVQIKTRTRVDEAFEVTADPWRDKVDGAARKVREHDLSRIHILAQVDDPSYGEMLRSLQGQLDVSVIDLRSFVAVQVAELRRQFRAMALNRLYDLLDRLQPETERVNSYVHLLARHGLTIKTPASPG